MAVTRLFERIVQGPGPIGPSPGFLLHAGESATVRIVVMENAWDDTVLLDLLVERSDDGGSTWHQESLSQVVGGSHSRDGSLPSQAVNNTYGADRLYRATMTLNSELSIGLDWENP